MGPASGPEAARSPFREARLRGEVRADLPRSLAGTQKQRRAQSQPTTLPASRLQMLLCSAHLFSEIPFFKGVPEVAMSQFNVGIYTPGSGWLISTLRADFVRFTSKCVRISPNLLQP